MADFENLLARLIEHRVEFVLVGGFAATAYGGTLLTQDVDVCLRFSPDNLMRLQEALADLHPVHRMTPQRLPLRLTPETCRDLKNLYLDTDLGQLDCLGTIQGVGDFEQREAAQYRSSSGCRCLSDLEFGRSHSVQGSHGASARPGVGPTIESHPRCRCRRQEPSTSP